MPILRREDGVAFVLQPYRETLAIKNTSLLRKEIQYLAETHGDNVRLFRLGNGEYEAVFSQESGYLLGEAVLAHFNYPTDLIYCEVVDKEEQQALLVIIRDGKVYLDAKLSFENLTDEVVSLLVETTSRYDIYIYGEITADFTQASVKTLNKLPESLLKMIEVTEKFALLSLEQALDEHRLSSKKRSSLIAITAICVLGLGALWWYARLQQPMIAQVSPYQQYQMALQTPDPGRQIQALTDGLLKTNELQGWVADSFNYNGVAASVPVHSMGGTALELMNEASLMGMNVSFGSEGAAVSFPTLVNPRSAPDEIASTQQVVAIIIDRMMQIIPTGKPVQVEDTVDKQAYNEMNVTITFNNISPDILQLIGSNLDDLPVRLTACTATIKEGLFSGKLQLAVVGN